MNLRIFLFVIALFASRTVFGNGATPDNHFFTVINEALEAQSRTASDLSQRRVNIEAFLSLAIKAAETQNLSNTVRLSIEGSAIQAYNDYLQAAPSVSNIRSQDVSAVLFLIQQSSDMLSNLAVPQVSLNVSPPIGTPGPVASGMDPNGIKDPKARAEYQQRIEENNKAIEEVNFRHRLEQGMATLKNTFKSVLTALPSKSDSDSIKKLIDESNLPIKIKAELLAEPSK